MSAANASFLIDNLPLEGRRCPKALSISYQDLDGEGTERNVNGVLVRQVIRRNVVKIEIEFAPMTTDDIHYIMAAFDKEKFSFTYPDPRTGQSNTITAYCGDRSVDIKRIGYTITKDKIGNYAKTDLYEGLRFSIIEY